jgi:hypothetical protein
MSSEHVESEAFATSNLLDKSNVNTAEGKDNSTLEVSSSFIGSCLYNFIIAWLTILIEYMLMSYEAASIDLYQLIGEDIQSDSSIKKDRDNCKTNI